METQTQSVPTNFTGRVICETISQRSKAAPGGLTEFQHNPMSQIVWVAKGGGRANIDGTMRGFGPSTALFIPFLTLYAFEFSAGSQGWIISLDQGFSQGLPEQPVLSSVTAMSDQSQLAYLFDSIDRENRSDKELSGRALECHVGLLAVWFMRHQQNMVRQLLPGDSARRRLMRRFIIMLNEKFVSQKSVSDYAAALSVTSTHLTRVCRQTTGKPASTLIQDRLIDAARHELRTTNLQISKIAAGLGFENSAYFTRLFSQKTGSSPSKFRLHSRH